MRGFRWVLSLLFFVVDWLDIGTPKLKIMILQRCHFIMRSVCKTIYGMTSAVFGEYLVSNMFNIMHIYSSYLF